MARVKTVAGSWYEYPRYYDLAMSEETPAESAFVEAIARKYLAGNGRLRVLEPACGTGRLTASLAALGHQVTGFDLSPTMVAYAQRRLARKKLRSVISLGDMRSFRFKRKHDIAVNFVNTFRHLPDESSALSHLRCVADALRPGGIYLLGLIVVPEDTTPEEGFERWTVRRGKTRVTVTLSVTSMNLDERRETMRTSMVVHEPRGSFRVVSEDSMRLYTADDIARLLQKAEEFQVEKTFDFWYDVNLPIAFGPAFYGDVVFMLRRR